MEVNGFAFKEGLQTTVSTYSFYLIVSPIALLFAAMGSRVSAWGLGAWVVELEAPHSENLTRCVQQIHEHLFLILNM